MYFPIEETSILRFILKLPKIRFFANLILCKKLCLEAKIFQIKFHVKSYLDCLCFPYTCFNKPFNIISFFIYKLRKPTPQTTDLYLLFSLKMCLFHFKTPLLSVIFVFVLKIRIISRFLFDFTRFEFEFENLSRQKKVEIAPLSVVSTVLFEIEKVREMEK